MVEQRLLTRQIRRAAQIAGLLLGSALITLLLLSPARAQETLVRIEIDAPIQPVPSGEEFEARVLVENVEHLAGFSFTIEFDPNRIEPIEDDVELAPAEQVEGDLPVRVLDVGAFLTESERSDGIICGRPVARDIDGDGKREVLAVSCVTTGPPVCLDGAPGVSGSGLLARVVFKSKGGGSTELRLAASTLALDDIADCDVDEGGAQQIPHRPEHATVELAGGDGISAAVVGIIVAIVVVVIAGAGGFLWYRRRAPA
jgi:hypothetical protein